jgi:hypothetical protein
LRIAALSALQLGSDLGSGLDGYAFHECDLTGLRDRLADSARAIVAEEPTPGRCLQRLGEELVSSPPVFWRPDDGARYDLVVCSGVLTQLQAGIRELIEDIFLARHSDGHSLLCCHAGWTSSVWTFARDLEHAFIDHLVRLANPGCLVYLADTVHVSWLTREDAEILIARGSWIATETSCLEDYLDGRFEVESRDSWSWFRPGQEDGFWGRLYGVQALVFRTLAVSRGRTSRAADAPTDLDGALRDRREASARSSGEHERQSPASRATGWPLAGSWRARDRSGESDGVRRYRASSTQRPSAGA